ncbi:MAG: 16S rRNA (cytidine(1402)-2'-O)-methyltransferase, partial [Bacteroidales bacterium]|nr:16S rRNA (cytidine(1402)-2'-O)-methyltransferase [Bacteroidales bacterium]
EQPYTTVLYESPHRLIKTLEQLAGVLGGDRRASVARELTKMFEENKRGSLDELIEYYGQKEIKGEIVLVIEGKTSGKKEKDDDEEDEKDHKG